MIQSKHLTAVGVENSLQLMIVTPTGLTIGDFLMDDGGMYHWRQKGEGWIGAYLLRELADLLDQANEPYQDQLRKDFEAGAFDSGGIVDPETGIHY